MRNRVKIFQRLKCMPMLHNAPIARISFQRTHLVALQTPSRLLSVHSLPSTPVRTKTNGVGDSEAESNQKRHLEPHVLSARLQKLCNAGNLDLAVTLLKNAPLDAQNPPVWNTLIRECMKANKYILSYKLFTDMKRRGFSPTVRTYQTMFKGLSRIEDWTTHTKQLSNAHALYEYFQKHVTSLKKHEPQSSELTTQPLNDYVKILGDAGDFQKIFDVYYSLDRDGPFSPDHFFYTAMFNAISNREASPEADASIRGILDPKLLWDQVIKAHQSGKMTIDSHLVASTIRALSRGRPADQNLALEITRDWLGLTSPTGRRPPKVNDRTSCLTTYTLEAALSLCIAMENYPLCVHFAKQAISDFQSPEVSLDRTTCNTILTACWRSADWPSAAATFQSVTGYLVEDFRDEAGEMKWYNPRQRRQAKRAPVVLDAECITNLLHTAHASDSSANMRQCLRIVTFLGTETLFHDRALIKTGGDASPKKQIKQQTAHKLKLANALKRTVRRVLDHRESELEVPQWRALMRFAENLTLPPNDFKSTPRPA